MSRPPSAILPGARTQSVCRRSRGRRRLPSARGTTPAASRQSCQNGQGHPPRAPGACRPRGGRAPGAGSRGIAACSARTPAVDPDIATRRDTSLSERPAATARAPGPKSDTRRLPASERRRPHAWHRHIAAQRERARSPAADARAARNARATSSRPKTCGASELPRAPPSSQGATSSQPLEIRYLAKPSGAVRLFPSVARVWPSSTEHHAPAVSRVMRVPSQPISANVRPVFLSAWQTGSAYRWPSARLCRTWAASSPANGPSTLGTQSGEWSLPNIMAAPPTRGPGRARGRRSGRSR